MNPQICDECKNPCDGCMVTLGTMTETEVMEILGNGNIARGFALLHGIVKGLYRARKLHPVFAKGKYEALGSVTAEVGEYARAIQKGEGIDREKDELLDVIIVAIRAWLDEDAGNTAEVETHGADAIV